MTGVAALPSASSDEAYSRRGRALGTTWKNEKACTYEEVYREWGWGLRVTELLLVGVGGWTALGLVGRWGVVAARGAAASAPWNRVAGRGLGGVSDGVDGSFAGTEAESARDGEPQCFDEMCFTVTRVEEVKGFLIRDGRRLVRVTVRVTNRGKVGPKRWFDRVYLTDAQGRRWEESAGVNGVGLRTRVAGGDSVMSEPVFKVAEDATGLRLVLTHGWKQPGVLVIGDSDSLLHRKTVVELGR